MLILLGFLILVVTYFLCGITIIGPNEMGVKVFFGSPRKVIRSGLHFVFPIIERVIRFTTAQEEIELETKIITAADEKHASAMVRVSLSFRFRWPADDGLIESVKIFRNFRREYLKSMLSEAVVDIAEAVGGQMNWMELFRNKKAFEQKVQAEITKNLPPESIIVAGKLQEPRILLIQVILPADLEKVITVPEVAKLSAAGKVAEAKGDKEATILRGEGEKQAMILRGEGEKQAMILRGKGEAQAVKEIYTAVAGPDYQKKHGVEIRKIEAIIELAKSPGKVIVSVPEISNALASARPLVDKIEKLFDKADGKAKAGGASPTGGTP